MRPNSVVLFPPLLYQYLGFFELVCLKSEGSVQTESTNEEFSRYFHNNLIEEDIETDMPIFTDDFAPVDQYNLNML